MSKFNPQQFQTDFKLFNTVPKVILEQVIEASQSTSSKLMSFRPTPSPSSKKGKTDIAVFYASFALPSR